jgi:hypothetical protein
MQEWLSPVLIGSTLMFVLTFTLTTILHELAHAIAAFAQGDSPVLYHTYVEHESMTPRQEFLTTAAGPLFSLVQGLAFVGAFSYFNRSPAVIQLFFLWMGLHGLINFFGYLISTPFAAHGDLGKVADYLDLGVVAKLALCALGLAANWIIGLTSRHGFLRLAPSFDLIATEAGRMSHIFYIAVMPWILGTIVILASRIPSPYLISLLYPVMSGLFTLIAWDTAGAVVAPAIPVGGWDRGTLWPLALIVILVLCLFRFGLARGVRLGRQKQQEAEPPA